MGNGKGGGLVGRISTWLLFGALAFACTELEGPELPSEPLGPHEADALDRHTRGEKADAEDPLALRRNHGAPRARPTLVLRATGFTRALVGKVLEAGFEAAYPSTDLVLLGSSERGAIQELILERAEAALVTMPLTAKERSRGLRCRLLGRHVLALVVHPRNPRRSVTEDQLRRMLTGELRTWSETGGARVELVLGPRGPLLDRAAKLLVPGEGFARRWRSSAEDSERAVIAHVRQSSRALGVVGLAALSRSGGVRVLDVAGTRPDAHRQGRYRYSVDLYLVWRRDRSRALQGLLDFVRSSGAQHQLGTWLTAP
ncbi:MAG: substrate-binding domain-containing protein [Planctomycetota bacterium]